MITLKFYQVIWTSEFKDCINDIPMVSFVMNGEILSLKIIMFLIYYKLKIYIWTLNILNSGIWYILIENIS